ncbi:hypothetical protein AB6A40_003605 [Gnathostoma spinigerum]|uniref:Uncharacterized protein n=1 Tax=Gnathostoma spinigerum TaxID=75299 RepID=A0ABD6EB79_9BILA
MYGFLFSKVFTLRISESVFRALSELLRDNRQLSKGMITRKTNSFRERRPAPSSRPVSLVETQNKRLRHKWVSAKRLEDVDGRNERKGDMTNPDIQKPNNSDVMKDVMLSLQEIENAIPPSTTSTPIPTRRILPIGRKKQSSADQYGHLLSRQQHQRKQQQEQHHHQQLQHQHHALHHHFHGEKDSERTTPLCGQRLLHTDNAYATEYNASTNLNYMTGCGDRKCIIFTPKPLSQSTCGSRLRIPSSCGSAMSHSTRDHAGSQRKCTNSTTTIVGTAQNTDARNIQSPKRTSENIHVIREEQTTEFSERTERSRLPLLRNTTDKKKSTSWLNRLKIGKR